MSHPKWQSRHALCTGCWLPPLCDSCRLAGEQACPILQPAAGGEGKAALRRGGGRESWREGPKERGERQRQEYTMCLRAPLLCLMLILATCCLKVTFLYEMHSLILEPTHSCSLFSLHSSAFWQFCYHLSLLEADLDAVHRVRLVKDGCLLAVWKAALGFLQQFYRLFIWENKGILSPEE